MTDVQAIAAATLIIYRDRAGAPAEHLIVERGPDMAFAPGAYVFPGGRVDPDDRKLAARFPTLAPEDAAARVAAIRETLEETGVAMAFVPPLDARTSAEARRDLAAGAALSAWLDRHNHHLDLDLLAPFARWQPGFAEVRVFDTRFYIARLDDEDVQATPDTHETTHLFWATAQDVLDRVRSGVGRLIFPTRRNLERLAHLPTFAEACAHVARHPVALITPTIETRDGVPHICLPPNSGYPVIAEPVAMVHRQ